ncbi:MAG TPA: fibronectin/fibrinogen-binding protein, partial [Clostridiaceae bacterium]|nr:fibronectin/fibrinogen-binding protein [Clostridiaceae bacterium]
MPLDGIVVDSIALELKDKILGGRIVKIFQPERDEILMHIRATGSNFKLLFSANANYPRVHLTNISKENPSNPPVFCMILRKYLLGGRILDVLFHDFERILTFNIESVNELGDLSVKKLIIEIMGRHSNIILVNENG